MKQLYLAGALEVGGVRLDEVVRVHILHRPRRRIRHPDAAAAGRGEGDTEWGAGRCGCSRLGFCGGKVKRRSSIFI
jgi:hypothetical protein